MNDVGRLHLFVAVCLFHVNAGSAAPPPSMTPDPALHSWFESLRQPGTGNRCCSISDCHFTSYRELNGNYEITIDGWPYKVPAETILHSIDNPTGQAVVCYNYTSFGSPAPRGEVRTTPQDTIEILCFLPFKPTS